jgi:hypothetical protein
MIADRLGIVAAEMTVRILPGRRRKPSWQKLTLGFRKILPAGHPLRRASGSDEPFQRRASIVALDDSLGIQPCGSVGFAKLRSAT